MINKVIKCNKENTPHLKGTLTIELNQVNTFFYFSTSTLLCIRLNRHSLGQVNFFLSECTDTQTNTVDW